MKLKVVIYSHDWAPSVGGIETVTMLLARGFAAWGQGKGDELLDVTVVTQTPAGSMDDSRLQFRVVRQPKMSKILNLLRAADVIHVANAAFVPLALGWLLGKATVLEHDGYQCVCPNGLLLYHSQRSVCPGYFMAGEYRKCLKCNSASRGWMGSFRDLLLTFPRRWLAGQATRNIAPTRHVGQRVSLPRTQLLYHGVPKPVRQSAIAQEGRQQHFVFAYVGRLVLEKGVDVLLRAASQLAARGYSFQIRIVGDGPERCNLERMAQEFGINRRVEFVGSVSADEVARLVADAVAVVMPSVWEDVAPLAASEQLMQGNLLIASDIGGLGEIVDLAGLKFPAGDALGLESCMRFVIENPACVTELRAAARKRGEDVFDEARMVEEHARLYRSVAISKTP